jgi:hypothetical protein
MPEGKSQGQDGRPREQPRRRKAVNWLRFWIEVLIAMVVFNVIAALVTWLFILPKLKG